MRELVLELATEDGHTPLLLPDLCLYRFSAPTHLHEGGHVRRHAGVVLQGEKRIRLGGHELAVDPQRLLVFTREGEHESSVVEATRQRPFSG